MKRNSFSFISKERGGGKKEKYRTRIQINGPTEHCRVDGPWPEIYIAIKMIFLFPLSAANLSMLMHVNLCSVSVIWNGSSSQKQYCFLTFFFSFLLFWSSFRYTSVSLFYIIILLGKKLKSLIFVLIACSELIWLQSRFRFRDGIVLDFSFI